MTSTLPFFARGTVINLPYQTPRSLADLFATFGRVTASTDARIKQITGRLQW